jgi:N-acyl-D-amino-acid deacylase
LGLDTGVVDYNYESKVPPWSTPGIVQFSAFVGFFDKYVNRQKVFTVEEAVQRTSTQAALNYGLEGRGEIREGCYADIVLMDLPNLKVMGTPLDSRQPPKGIEYVFVNGRLS